MYIDTGEQSGTSWRVGVTLMLPCR
jgi:hypothetical protein